MNNIKAANDFFYHHVQDSSLMRHSINVAKSSERIAKCLNLDSSLAYCCGLLHDIGKIKGSIGLLHTYEGYRLLCENQVITKPDICLTHSFPLKNINCYLGMNDCNPEERIFIQNYLDNIKYNLYDNIVQLSDAISGAEGFMTLEISMVKVALKYGTNELTQDLWKSYFEIYNIIEGYLGKSVYSVLNSNVLGYS